MNPLAICQLLLAQHGRLPSLSELLAAMGAPSVGAGAEAGAEDAPLTDMLRQRDAWDQATVRMMFLGGGGGGSGALLAPPQSRPSIAMGGRGHFLPVGAPA